MNARGRCISVVLFAALLMILAGCFPNTETVATVTPALLTITPSPLPRQVHLPAFPGAEGFGAETAGGRGGNVLEVTNLNDAGPGSLRSAMEAKGPRVVVFRVAGTIPLKSSLIVTNPYLTIAGQTAPGGGVTLRGDWAGNEGLIQIMTHDVVIRYLTVRAGPPSAGDGIEVFATDAHETYNIVIDHNSVSWAVNRNLATWYDVHDISIQWNMFSEALDCTIHPKGCHSKGVLLGGYASDEEKDEPGAYNISLHHNLMAHNGERNPYIKAAGVVDVVNNVVYNPFGTFSHIDMESQLAPDLVNYRSNYFKPGPDTEVKYAIRAIYPGPFGAKIFIQGNIGPQRESDDLPEVNIVDPDSRNFVVQQPFPAEAITTTSAFQAYDQVLEDAGASKGLNCDGIFVPRRDAIDSRIVNEVQNGLGKVIDDPSEVGGWLNIAPATPCVDTDHDGMSNQWEKLYGFDLDDPSDAAKDFNGNGYTNIEEYLNGSDPLR
jgi:pectate lyase